MANPEPTKILLSYGGSKLNPVGNAVTFTATLLDQYNTPMGNVDLQGGIIEGVNSRSFGGLTDAGGKISWTYSGTKAGQDAIEIYWEKSPKVMGPPISYITYTWYIPEPTSVELSHTGSGHNPVGASHTFTARLFDQQHNPMGNVDLNGGIIEGVNHRSFAGTTGPDGMCSFSYTGKNAGEDVIEIYHEDPPGTMGPPIAYLTKIWYTPFPSGIHLRHRGSPVNRTGSDHTVIATVEDQHHVPMKGIIVTGGILQGVHQGKTRDFGPTNARGQAAFTYHGTKKGTDIISASIRSTFGKARRTIETTISKTWI